MYIASVVSSKCYHIILGFRQEYEAMRAAYREKGRSRHSKTETLSSEQLQAYFLDYQEDAALFIFRLKSLKQGQFRSILTQAARHHSAQVL
jgi:hypothetical protein